MSPRPPRRMAPHPTTAVPLATGPYCHGCPIALGGLGAARHALHLRSRTSPLLARSGPAFARHWRVDRPSRPMTGGIRASSEGGRLAQSRGSTFASAALARGRPPQGCLDLGPAPRAPPSASSLRLREGRLPRPSGATLPISRLPSTSSGTTVVEPVPACPSTGPPAPSLSHYDHRQAISRRYQGGRALRSFDMACPTAVTVEQHAQESHT